MVEGGDLGDHPADADAGEVCRPAAERVDEGRGIAAASAARSPSVYAGFCASVVVDSPLSRKS